MALVEQGRSCCHEDVTEVSGGKCERADRSGRPWKNSLVRLVIASIPMTWFTKPCHWASLMVKYVGVRIDNPNDVGSSPGGRSGFLI